MKTEAARPRSGMDKLVLHRRASGPAVEALCEELAVTFAGMQGVYVTNPGRDERSAPKVMLLWKQEMTDTNAALLAGMSKAILFRRLRQKQPSLQDTIRGLAFAEVYEPDKDAPGRGDLGLLEVEPETEAGYSTGLMTREQSAIWQVLQTDADRLQARRGQEPESLERAFLLTPYLKVLHLSKYVAEETAEQARAIIVKHSPIGVDLTYAIPRPHEP